MRSLGYVFLASTLLASTGFAQSGGWNPLDFPNSAPRVSPAPPIRSVASERAVGRAPGASGTSAVSPAARESAQSGASSSSGASRTSPEQGAGAVRPAELPAGVQSLFSNYLNYQAALNDPSPNSTRISSLQEQYERELAAFAESNPDAFLSGESDGEPLTDQTGVIEAERKRLVLKRAKTGWLILGADIYEGEGGSSSLSAVLVKPAVNFGSFGRGPKRRLMFRSTRSESTDRAVMIEQRDGTWVFSKPTSSRDTTPISLMEFRPAGNGYDVYDVAGQLFARIRWESRKEALTEGGEEQDVVQRVIYFHGEGQDSLVASVVTGQINQGAPALLVRRGAGPEALRKMDVVLQDWEAGDDDVKDYLASLVDSLLVDMAVQKVGWRDATGIMKSYSKFHNDKN